MPDDMRAAAARYYDEEPPPFDNRDIPFYISRLPVPHARVLELGCGTGRVLVPLAAQCGFILGVDLSEAMLDVCRRKLQPQGLGPERAALHAGDITQLDLGQRFDLIIAPFRVFQNLESNAQVDGFFETVRRHLAPGGRCVLNAFNPFGDVAAVRAWWASRSELVQQWEKPYRDGRLSCFERIAGVHPEMLICYPVLTYRYYMGDRLIDEATLEIAMRAYYPDELRAIIAGHGFKVVQAWGGYNGEAYGQGPELVMVFTSIASSFLGPPRSRARRR